MDPAQAAQMITWLDEEQRKAKALVAELRDQLQKQAMEMADQRKRFEDLQGRLVRLQTEVTRLTQVDQLMAQLKSEMAAVLRDVREELRKHDQQALRARQVEREAEAKLQLELSQRVERVLTLDDKATTMATEQQRQNEMLVGLRQRLDNVDKELVRRADQRRLDDEEHRREMERTEAMRQTVESLRAQNETNAARFQYLERWAQASAQRTADLQAFRAEMQRLQADLLEGLRRSEQRVEKQVRDWATITETLHRDQETWANQLRIFSEQHERTKKALASVQDLAKDLRVAQDEARQSMGLGGEKQRRELREWQGENEKRWTRYLAQWEYRWSEQRKADDAMTGRLDELGTAVPGLEKDVQALRTALAEESNRARAASADLWRYELEGLQRELDVMKASAEQARARIEQLVGSRREGAAGGQAGQPAQ